MQTWVVFTFIMLLSLIFLITLATMDRENYRYTRYSPLDNRAAISPCLKCGNDNSECNLVNMGKNNIWTCMAKNNTQTFYDCNHEGIYSSYPSYYTMNRLMKQIY